MNLTAPGQTQITYSRTEKIGLPNWSFVHITASATTVAQVGEYTPVYNFLFDMIEFFLKERTEAVARSLNLWAGLPSADSVSP